MSPRLATPLGTRRARLVSAAVVTAVFAVVLIIWTRGPGVRTDDAQAARIVRSRGGAPALVTSGPSLPGAGDDAAPQGDAGSLPNGTHDVVLSVTSDRPLASVGWTVVGHKPGSRKLTSVRSPFRLHVLAHGEGLVASVAAQAAPDATRTTCSVSVDGKVRSTHTRHGGYEVVACLG